VGYVHRVGRLRQVRWCVSAVRGLNTTAAARPRITRTRSRGITICNERKTISINHVRSRTAFCPIHSAPSRSLDNRRDRRDAPDHVFATTQRDALDSFSFLLMSKRTRMARGTRHAARGTCVQIALNRVSPWHLTEFLARRNELAWHSCDARATRPD